MADDPTRPERYSISDDLEYEVVFVVRHPVTGDYATGFITPSPSGVLRWEPQIRNLWAQLEYALQEAIEEGSDATEIE